MKAIEFWKIVTMDHANLLEKLLSILTENNVRYCVIGGQAVNAYAEPVVTLDLDLVIAVDQLDRAESILAQSFNVKRFPHSINISLPDSDLRVQIQTDERYADFVARASYRPVLGVVMPVATPMDILQGKIWAVQDPARRISKRQKDLADIARLLEEFPYLRTQVPEEVLSRLYQ